MRKFIMLIILFSLVSCMGNSQKGQIKRKRADVKEKPLSQEKVISELIIEDKEPDELEVEVGSNEYNRRVKILLSHKEGDVVKGLDEIVLNPKNTNKVIYSTEGIEYTEEWRVRAYKVTKEHLKVVIPKSLSNCYVNSFGYYEPSYVKYIGNNTFRVKVYLTFKCGKDDYENRRYFWFETSYSENTNLFNFNFIQQKFAD